MTRTNRCISFSFHVLLTQNRFFPPGFSLCPAQAFCPSTPICANSVWSLLVKYCQSLLAGYLITIAVLSGLGMNDVRFSEPPLCLLIHKNVPIRKKYNLETTNWRNGFSRIKIPKTHTKNKRGAFTTDCVYLCAMAWI